MSGDSLSDMMTANVVVIQPGSLYLRLGRGCDSSPVKVVHAIARRRTRGGRPYQDSLLVPQAKLSSEARQGLEQAKHQVYQALRGVTKKDGTKRQPPRQERISEFNSNIEPDPVEITEDADNKDLELSDDVVVGDDILRIPKSGLPQYNLHFPFRRGDLNLHPDVGGSFTSILRDLQDIWSRSIETHLGIQPNDLKHYKAVLVIPALYKRSSVKHYLSLLLLSLGFGGCFVVQDHVAATFGSGLASACVVDVGDQKVSVSCVEDGVSLARTRLQLGCGGSDISHLLLNLTRSNQFPYKSCDPSNVSDGLVVHQMKEERCHLSLDCHSLVRHLLTVRTEAGQTDRYSVYLGDEQLVAPLGFFQPELLELTGKKTVTVMGKDPGDSEDPHDHLYLRETSRKYTKPGDIIQNEDAEFDDNDVDSAGPDVGGDGNLLSLEQAILRSVEMCGTEDLKRKMLASILVVGGGFRFPGAASYLQSRLLQLVSGGKTSEMTLEVITDPRDCESDAVTWRGAAIMSSLESAQELWIRPKEWGRLGQKILRERAPFPWA